MNEKIQVRNNGNVVTMKALQIDEQTFGENRPHVAMT